MDSYNGQVLMVNQSIYGDPGVLFNGIFENWYNDKIAPQMKPDYDSNLTSYMAYTTEWPQTNYDIEICIEYYELARKDYEHIIAIINKIIYVIISIGILFNILNLVVLLKTNLNESPYTYLTVLAISDLGALSVYGLEALRQFAGYTFIENFFIIITTPLLNIFLSISMYATLALTIERFIFVHMPFRSKTICHKSVARKVCLAMVIFSVARSLYLPFMYEKPKCIEKAWVQKDFKGIDIYEFLVSLAIPYSIIFIANISLIISLKKQNNLMRHTTFSNHSNLLLNTKSKSEKSRLSIAKEMNASETEVLKNASSPQLGNRRSIVHVENHFYRSSNRREYRNQKKLTISLIFILCSLLVCYFPSFLFEESLIDAVFGEFRYDLSERSKRILKIKGLGTRISLALIYVNCSCNFLIYCISNERFKKALVSLLKIRKSTPRNFIIYSKFNFKNPRPPVMTCDEQIEIRI